MFIQSSSEFILKKPIIGVVQIFSANNDSILVSYHQNTAQNFVHIDKDGDQLYSFCIQYPEPIKLVCMNDHMFAFLNYQFPASNIITVINLETKSVKQIRHNCNNAVDVKLLWFEHSQLLCVIERNYLKITYYSLQGIEVSGNYFKNNLCSTFLRADDESSVIAIEMSYFEGFITKLFLFGLNKVKEEHDFSQLQYKASDIVSAWICEPNQICLQFLSYPKFYTLTVQKKKDYIQTPYKFTSNQGKIILSKVVNLGKHSICLLGDSETNQLVITAFDNQYKTKVPVVHQDPRYFQEAYCGSQHETLIFPDTNATSGPGFDNEIMTIRKLSFFTIKEIEFHFMLELNEDFNDELLQDAISILCQDR